MSADAAPFAPPARVLIVIVLYKLAAEVSTSVLGVVAALLADEELNRSYELLLWDNSPVAQLPGLQLKCRYEHGVVNDGVAGGFRRASDICMTNGYEWMLLLDQDSRVTEEFLRGMLQARAEVEAEERIGAIAPVLMEGETQLSPKQVLRFRDVPVAPAPARVLEGEVFAANSGVMMRVEALQDIGGYSLDFWLDHSDVYVFHQLWLRGWRTYLAGGVRLQHSLAMQDYDGRMTEWRYENFLHAEQAFSDLFKDRLEGMAQVLRMLARSVRQRRYRNKMFSRMTWRFLVWRLRTTRAARLRAWTERRLDREQRGESGRNAEIVKGN